MIATSSVSDETRLALDIATILARVLQMHREGVDDLLTGAHAAVWDRIITCDVPRLRAHITALDPTVDLMLDEAIDTERPWTKNPGITIVRGPS